MSIILTFALVTLFVIAVDFAYFLFRQTAAYSLWHTLDHLELGETKCFHTGRRLARRGIRFAACSRHNRLTLETIRQALSHDIRRLHVTFTGWHVMHRPPWRCRCCRRRRAAHARFDLVPALKAQHSEIARQCIA